MLGRVSLAATAFDIGWRIGSGVNRVLFPETAPAATVAPSFTGPDMTAHSAGDVIVRSSGKHGSYTISAPSNGWHFAWSSTTGFYYETVPGGSCSGKNHFSGPPPPEGFRRVYGPLISLPPPDGCSFQMFVFYSPETGRPLENYASQPYRGHSGALDGSPTSQAELEQRVRVQLESGAIPEAEAFWAEQLDPVNHDSSTGDDERACEFPHAGQDPGAGRGTREPGQGTGSEEEYQLRYELAPESAFPQAGISTLRGQVYLRWGFATANLANSIIDWRGWGYRKIAAKHGWGSEDRSRTIEALQFDTQPEVRRDGRDRHVYRGPIRPGRNGADCQREVTVDYERDGDEIDFGAPNAAGINTSFERVLP